MRISPVHGEQWPVAALHTPVPPAEPVTTTAAQPAVVAASAAAADSRSGAEHRHGQGRRAVFDPPLIAQRAALGLSVGTLIADCAEARGVPFTTVARAVDLAMEQARPHEAPSADAPAVQPSGSSGSSS